MVPRRRLMTRDIDGFPAELYLRPAVAADRDLLLKWRNDPQTRSVSRDVHVISADEHDTWLKRVLADPTRRLLIAELDGAPIGEVRFDRLGPGCYEVSISLAPDARGRGLGSRLLRFAVEWAWRATNARLLDAAIREGNEASMRIFLKAGFRPSGKRKDDF